MQEAQRQPYMYTFLSSQPNQGVFLSNLKILICCELVSAQLVQIIYRQSPPLHIADFGVSLKNVSHQSVFLWV